MEKELPDKIIGLDQVRISRGLGKICKCNKRKFVIDTDNRRITCNSCGAVVDPYEAMLDLAGQHEEYNRQAEYLLEQKKQITKYKPWLRVIKNLESHYRGHQMLPVCPRCSEAFYLEELTSWVGKKFGDALIKKYQETHKD